MSNLDLLTNKELRENMIEKIEVLEQVKEILTLENTDFLTVELASMYYEVGLETIKTLIKRNKEELESDGLKILSGNETREFLVKFKMNLTNYKGYFEANGQRFANRSNILIPKRALLRIGMLLRDSEVAKELRTRLLDIVYDAETQTNVVETVVEEIRTEQQIGEDMTQAILNGDYAKLTILQTELISLKNKRITKLKETVTSNVSIQESKAIINMCVRKMASCKYNGMFSKAWNEFYKFVNYKIGINIKARNGKKPYINNLTDEELGKVEVIAKCWLEESNVEIDFTL